MRQNRYQSNAERPKPRPTPRPLDAARIEELALRYVARFATSAAKLERYLVRKLRERGWDGECEPPIKAISLRMVAAGYVDDEAFARTKSGGLLRRGYGRRRIDSALSADGIAEDLRDAVRAGLGEQRGAALALARKRRFGPYGAALPDRDLRQKQLAAMLRAGHPLDMARELVNASSVDAAEIWAAEEDE